MTNQEENVLITPKGLVLLMFSTLKIESTKKIEFFKFEVCKTLALNGYSKNAMGIMQEIRYKDTIALAEWINEIWDKYIDSFQVMEIFESLAEV